MLYTCLPHLDTSRQLCLRKMDRLGSKKVLVLDGVDGCCAEILRAANFTVDVRSTMPKDELITVIKDFDAVIVRSATKVTAEVIQAASNLKAIGRAGTGVDNIDLKAATAKGVAVINTPAANSISAAEHTCAMISAVARNIPQGHFGIKNGKWDRKKCMGVELQGKTLAIIGLGRIGREVATRMQSFGMRTIGYDPLVPAPEAAKFGVQFFELEEIWPQADFITVHTPLIPATKGLLGKKSFPKCRKGVRVVNVARGGIIDENDLVEALESGQVGGAALDVFEKEPPTNEALLSQDRLVMTPHLGASTKEAQRKVAEEIAELFVAAAEGRPVPGLVNAPALASCSQPGGAEWVTLSTRLAAVLSALIQTEPTEVTVTVTGKALAGMKEAILTAVLQGLVPGNCNLINAKAKALEKNITSSVKCTEGEDKVTIASGGRSVEGTAVGGRLLLTAINDNNGGVFEMSGSVAVGKLSSLACVSKGGVQGVMVSGPVAILRLTNGTVPPDSTMVKW